MENLDKVLADGQVITKAKSAHVFLQGDVDQHLYFLKSGLLKAYYLTQDGKEFVKSFIQPGNIIGSMTACYNEQSCSFNLQCLEDCELIQLPFQTLRNRAEQDADVAQVMLETVLQFSMKKEQREYEFLCLSAEQRYRLLKKRSPELLEKVTQNDVARYLGVTPVALSRIKARVAQLGARGPY